MVDGFVKCAAAGIKVQVADTVFNAKQIMDKTKECAEKEAKVIVFGELSISAATCGDLFFQPKLIAACEEAVKDILEKRFLLLEKIKICVTIITE